MEDKKSLGNYIMTKRKEAGLTQKAFADQLFITESAVSKWERGLSYPDISLIRKICTILEISEHELLTATEDTEIREMERRARNYKRMGTVYQYTLLILYGAALVTCFICNLAIDRKLSWFFIVFSSIAVAFSLTLLPLYVKKNTGLVVLGAFAVSLSLLLFVCNVYSGGTWLALVLPCIVFGLSLCFLPFVLKGVSLHPVLNEKKAMIYFVVNSILLFFMLYVIFVYNRTPDLFFTKAMPIAAFSLTLPWAIFLILRYTRINALLKTSACLACSAIFFQFINAFLSKILGESSQNTLRIFHFQNRQYLDYIGGDVNFIVMICVVVLTVVFAVTGFMRMKKKA